MEARNETTTEQPELRYWIEREDDECGGGYIMCSACHYRFPAKKYWEAPELWKYCPNCGHPMQLAPSEDAVTWYVEFETQEIVMDIDTYKELLDLVNKLIDMPAQDTHEDLRRETLKRVKRILLEEADEYNGECQFGGSKHGNTKTITATAGRTDPAAGGRKGSDAELFFPHDV